MDNCVQGEWHWSCEGTTASIKEDYVVLEVLLVEREGFRVLSSTTDLAPVAQKVDNAIHRINHYPADSVVCFVNTYPLDSDLSGG